MPQVDGVYPRTARTTPTRYRDRASYERAAVHAVLDEALVAHVGFVLDGAPVVLPTVHVRVGDTVYVHGSSGGRFARLDGAPVCVTVSLVDGLVFARSWTHHSAAYRSVVAHGVGRLVRDERERREVLAALLEHMAAGRSEQSRPPDAKELAAVAVVAVELGEVSLKARGGQAGDEPEDLAGPYWAGLVPWRPVAGAPVPAPDLAAGIEVPGVLADYRRPVGGVGSAASRPASA